VTYSYLASAAVSELKAEVLDIIRWTQEQTKEQQASVVQEDTPRKHHSVGQEWKGIIYEYNITIM
jgi:hypothetical protein